MRKIDSLPFQLIEKKYLVFQNGIGEILSHYITDNNKIYFEFFYDFEDDKFLFFQVNENDLYKFFNLEITLRNLIDSSLELYLFIYNNITGCIDIFQLNPSELDNENLPSNKSYFNEQNYEKYAIELKKQIEANNEKH